MPASQRAGVIPGTDFLPQEIQTVSERNLNAYLMLSFGNDEYADGGLKLPGNIGVRYVDTKLRSAGPFGIPPATTMGVTAPSEVRCALKPPPDNAPPGTPPTRPAGISHLRPERSPHLPPFPRPA